MPIYEYRCAACGHTFERLQKMSDPDPEHCPHCEATAISRLISPVGFRLKGGGWYETDFKQSGRRNVSGEAGGAEKKSEKSEKAAEKSADKPAAKPDGAGGKTDKTDGSKSAGGKAAATSP